MERGFAVIGLGYVGLPVALALAKKFEPVIGFDISQRRIAALRDARDATGDDPRPQPGVPRRAQGPLGKLSDVDE